MASETRPDGTPRAPLRFSSSASRPLAWIAGRPVSVGRFRADVEQLLLQFQHHDSPAGDVLIRCSGRYAFGVALLAAWLNGRSALLPPNPTPQTLSDIRDQATIAFDCDDAWAQQLRAPAGEDHNGHGHWQPPLPDNSQHPAVSLFTSGSTGTPKRVSKSLSQLLSEAHSLARQFQWPDGAILAAVPPQHLYGLTFSVMLPWVLGQPWVDDLPRYPSDVLEAIQRNHAAILISVPAHYQALLEHDSPLHTQSLGMFCVSAAAPLSDSVARRWQQRHGNDILEIYGSTETGVVAWRQQRLTSYWQALPSVQLSAPQGLLTVASPFVSAPPRSAIERARLCHCRPRQHTRQRPLRAAWPHRRHHQDRWQAGIADPHRSADPRLPRRHRGRGHCGARRRPGARPGHLGRRRR